MARAKKNETTMTLEEKLDRALVPNWNFPYKIPDNWCWVKLSALSSIISKGTTPPGGKSAYNSDGIRFLRVENINEDGTISHENIAHIDENTHYNFLKRSILQNRDVLISIAGTLGKTGIIYKQDLPLNTNQAIAFIRLASDSINERFIKYAIDSPMSQKMLLGKAKVTAIPNLTLEIIGDCPIPLAPTAEQQRIVNRIESLFAKLDEAKEKAQATLDSFETRKASILHKAFTGELTAEWRKKNNQQKEQWLQGKLSDFCNVNPSKANTKDLPDELDVSFVPMPALSDVLGEITNPQIRKLKEVRSGFTNFSEGDVVFAKITPCMENGKSAVVGPLVNGIGFGTTEFYVLRCSELLVNRFLYHMVRDISFRNKAKAVMTGAVGQQRVPKRFIEDYPLTLPSVSEQNEIVSIIDKLFAKEMQAKEAAEMVLDQIDLMKKAILSRAFRGELGTNDPTEESALELLKQILSEKTEGGKAPKKSIPSKKIPTELAAMLYTKLETDIVKLFYQHSDKAVSIDEIMAVGKNKIGIISTLTSLEQREIIVRLDQTNYCIKE